MHIHFSDSIVKVELAALCLCITQCGVTTDVIAVLWHLTQSAQHALIKHLTVVG